MDDIRIVYIVDDDPAVRQAVGIVARALRVEVRAFARAEDFLAACDESTTGCLVLDVRMPETSGIELQRTLNAAGVRIPIIMMSGHADVRMAVEAMSQGAFTFLEKPFRMEELSRTIEEALAESHSAIEAVRRNAEIKSRFESLTHKEREVLDLILKGKTNREMALELKLSLRAIEDRRSRVMKRMETSSVVDLVSTVQVLHNI
tara:strand:- start:164048 stop:164659 length:612 start_codon:yes stop_codon:yes gene_type:complete